MSNPTVAFVDGDWLGCAGPHRPPFSFAALKRGLDTMFGDGLAVHVFLTRRKGSDAPSRTLSELASSGCIVHFVDSMFGASPIDVALAVEAAAMLPRVRQIVLVSGDSDFVPLLSLARRSGVRVVLAALPLVTQSGLTGNADVFVSVEALVTRGERQRPTGGASAPAKRSIPDQIVIRPGQEFASYELIRGLFVSAESSVTVIDNYIDGQVLYMLQVAAPAVAGRIFTSKIQSSDFGGHVQRMRDEGRTLEVFRTKTVHDRLLRIDGDWIHSGASFKDLGAKLSVLNRMKRPVPADDLDVLEKDMLATAQRIY